MPPKRKPGRPSNAERGIPSNSAAPSPPKKLGRPPKSGASALRQPARRDEAPASSYRAKPGRKPGRPSQTQPVAEASGSRKRKTRDEELDAEGEPLPKKFQQLSTRSRYIPHSVIAAKWQAPTPQMQRQISNLFKIASRPVITARPDERKRLQAEKVIQDMILKLEKRLPKMPFPPNTNETDFDLERVVERNKALENQLTPAMHSTDLLKGMIDKEEAQLRKDKEVLVDFESNARVEKAALKNLSVKPHHILRLPKNFEIGSDSAEAIGLVKHKAADQSLFDDVDPELAPLLDTLRNHLESMQGNHEQVHGIDAAVRKAQAALDEVLFKHASPQQYDSVSAL